MLTALNSTAKNIFNKIGSEPIYPPNDVTISSLTSTSVTITFTPPDCKFDQYIYYLYTGLTKTIDISTNSYSSYQVNNNVHSRWSSGDKISKQGLIIYKNERPHVAGNKGTYYVSQYITNTSNGLGCRFSSPYLYTYTDISLSATQTLLCSTTTYPGGVTNNGIFEMAITGGSKPKMVIYQSQYIVRITGYSCSNFLVNDTNTNIYVSDGLPFSKGKLINKMLRPTTGGVTDFYQNGLSISDDGMCGIYYFTNSSVTPQKQRIYITLDGFNTVTMLDLSDNIGIKQPGSLSGGLLKVTYDKTHFFVAMNTNIAYVNAVDFSNNINTPWGILNVGTTLKNIDTNNNGSILYATSTSMPPALYRITGFDIGSPTITNITTNLTSVIDTNYLIYGGYQDDLISIMRCSTCGNIVVITFTLITNSGNAKAYPRYFISSNQGNTFTIYYPIRLQVATPYSGFSLDEVGNICMLFISGDYANSIITTLQEYKRNILNSSNYTASNTATSVTINGLSANTYYTFAIKTTRGSPTTYTDWSYERVISVKTP